MLVTLTKYKHAIAGSFLNLFMVSSLMTTTQVYGKSYRGGDLNMTRSASNTTWPSNGNETVLNNKRLVLREPNKPEYLDYRRSDNSLVRNAGPTPPETESFR